MSRDTGTGKHRHHPVQERVWSDPDFVALSHAPPNAQTLWLYLLTCEHRRLPGVIVAGKGTIADGLQGWSVADVERCAAEMEARGMIACDWPARVIYLVSTFKADCNKPAGANAAATWRRVVNDLPSESLRARVHADIRAMLRREGADYLACYDSGTGKNKGKNYRKNTDEVEGKINPSDNLNTEDSDLSSSGRGAGEGEDQAALPGMDPIPTRDAYMDAIAAASSGMFVRSPPSKGGMFKLDKARKRPNALQEAAAVGRLLGAGGDWRTKKGQRLDGRYIGEIDAWLAQSAAPAPAIPAPGAAPAEPVRASRKPIPTYTRPEETP